jgi:hypothetical protein
MRGESAPRIRGGKGSLLDTSWPDEYRGLSMDEAIALALSQKRRYQVVDPDTVRTADLDKRRLNVVVDAEGSLIGFEAS